MTPRLWRSETILGRVADRGCRCARPPATLWQAFSLRGGRGQILPRLGVRLVIDVPKGSAIGRVENDVRSNGSNPAVAEQEIVISPVAAGGGEIIRDVPTS